MGPFIERPPGRLYGELNVVGVDDHASALIVAQAAAPQLTPHLRRSADLTQPRIRVQLAGIFRVHLDLSVSLTPTMTVQIQECLSHVGSVSDEAILPSSLFSFRCHGARGGNRTHNLRFTRAVL